MLRPDILWNNPVMCVVEVGTLLSILYTAVKVFDPAFTQATLGYLIVLDFWLVATVLYANFAGALADALRKTKQVTPAFRQTGRGTFEDAVSTDLNKGDVVAVETGRAIPADGEIS